MPERAVTTNLVRIDRDDDLHDVVERATVALSSGATVIVPTDTVYGVAAHIECRGAIDELFALKGRDHAKALPVLVADEAQADQVLDRSVLDPHVAEKLTVMVRRGWPGALTVVGPRQAKWRQVDLGGDAAKIGVRVPASPVVRAIAGAVGPLVTTSANRSGEPTPTDAHEAARSLAGAVALVIDAGPGGTVPSTVVDVSSFPFTVLRQGGFEIDG